MAHSKIAFLVHIYNSEYSKDLKSIYDINEQYLLITNNDKKIDSSYTLTDKIIIKYLLNIINEKNKQKEKWDYFQKYLFEISENISDLFDKFTFEIFKDYLYRDEIRDSNTI